MKTKINRWLAGMLTAIMILSMIPVSSFAAEADLTIGNYAELLAFAESVNGGETYEGKTVRLDVNVELGGETNLWVPIGTSGAPFSGTFDGNYHVVSGLYVNSDSNAGFFGYVKNGNIKNLVVRGNVTGKENVGGIVGNVGGGDIVNCGNEADVSGGRFIGGVAGYVSGTASVDGCYNTASVNASTGYIGGVVGTFWGTQTAKNCYNTGTVTGPATVGGVLGGHKAKSPTLENCYNAGEITNSGAAVNNHGSLIGAKGSIVNCYDLSDSSFPGVGTTGDAADKVSELTASQLGEAFVDGTPNPRLAWESSVSADAPSEPSFTESTELSARLAEYIKASVKSAMVHGNVSGTFLGDPAYMAGASSTATDWMAMAMGRFGYFDVDGYHYIINDGTGYEDYLGAMKEYIQKTYAENSGILHSAKATEWHRAVVAIAALGGDPTHFGMYNGEGIDLIADGSYNNTLKAGPGTQGINGWIWGLISMDTGMYDVPEGAKYTRETFITEILKMQLTDGGGDNEYGGWVLGGYGTTSDVDITAMALQALAPYYNDDTVYTYVNENSKTELSKTVRQCVDEALDRLGSMMNRDGGFTSWNTNNVESISQVVVALCSLGIDPMKDGRFITSGGKTLLDGILQFRLSDGGFCHVSGGGWNSMANDQATYALVSYWRFENGMRTLYDMRGAQSDSVTEAIVAATEAINDIPDPSSPDYKQNLKSALEIFRNVPESERRYVKNYSELAAALDLIGGEGALDTDTPYIISISVSTPPDKTRYYEGDDFDPAGMTVTATYSDGTVAELNGYGLSVKGKLELGTDTVYITYGVLRTSINIEVREHMPWSGEGTEEEPYIIKTADDLVDLRLYVYNKRMNTAGVWFEMTDDINLENVSDWRGIGDSVTEGFRGHFNGGGHSVWNINGSTYNACGLFGCLGDGAVIENLTVASCNLGGSYNFSIGAIAGKIASNASATIRNCHNYASLRGSWGIGGILGQVEDGARAVVENCSNYGTVTASYTGGGIIGQVGPNRWRSNGASAEIDSCYNSGKIGGIGEWGIGGIVGSWRLCGDDAKNTIKNSYNAGTVADSEAAGAVFGSAANTSVAFENIHYLNTSNDKVSGVFTDDGSDTEGVIVGQAIGNTDSEMKESAFVSVLGSAFAEDTDGINSGYPIIGQQKAPGKEAPVRAGLEIGTAEELAAFAARVNAGESFTGKTVAMTANIDLSNISDWTPIGKSSRCQFDGTFDGQYHVIDNLYSAAGGLFGYVCENAVIKNVGVGSGEIGSSNVSFMGGIARWSNGADFINCWNGADIYCSGYSGGIVGTVRDGGESKITGCYNRGDIYASDGAVGGITGHLGAGGHGVSVNVAVSDCYNIGNVTASDNAAGIVGSMQDGHTVKNCYNAGEVKVTGENILDGAGAIASLVTRNNEISNCYFDAAYVSVGISNGDGETIGMTSAEMAADTFAQLLGDGFKTDPYALVNGGYLLVIWQSTEDADAIDEVKAMIDAIGTVTADSAAAIGTARSAYDGLDEELRQYVSNLGILEAAESALAEIQALAEAKASAAESLNGYKNPSDYRAEEQEEMARIISDGRDAIAAAADIDAVAKALDDAKAHLDELKTASRLDDEEAAQAVSDMIDAIGNVTPESKDSIISARRAYDELSDSAKALVKNVDVLDRAEAHLEELIKHDEDQDRPQDQDVPRENGDNKTDTDSESRSNTEDSNVGDGSVVSGIVTGRGTPETGDTSNILFCSVIAVISLCAFFVAERARKRV